MLDKIKSTFPDRAGVIHQINMIMQQERKNKITEFVEQWSQMPSEDKVVLSKQEWLMIFGRPHTHTNTITGPGLITTINGTKYIYDSFEPSFRANQHLDWQIIYDEYDMTQVLAVNAESRLQYVLEQKRVLPMDIKSMSPEDHEHLSKVRLYNKDRKEEIIQTYISDAEIVDELVNNTPLNLDDYDEATLKMMFTINGQQKESLQDAKGLKEQQRKQLKEEQTAAENWQAQQLEYLKGKTDFNQYKD